MKPADRILLGFVAATLVAFHAVAEEKIEFYLECLSGECRTLKGKTAEEKGSLTPELSILPSELVDAFEYPDLHGTQQVGIRFNPEHTKKFAEITRSARGKRLHIVIGDEVVMSPVIQSEIKNGEVIITMGAGRGTNGLWDKLPQLKLKADEKKLATEQKEKAKAIGLFLVVIVGTIFSVVFIFRKKKKAAS